MAPQVCRARPDSAPLTMEFLTCQKFLHLLRCTPLAADFRAAAWGAPQWKTSTARGNSDSVSLPSTSPIPLQATCWPFPAIVGKKSSPSAILFPCPRPEFFPDTSHLLESGNPWPPHG